MSYVGAVTVTSPQPTLDRRLACRGYQMDNGRKVKFWASMEALEAYLADTDDDAFMVVAEKDVTWLARRDGGRSMWSCAGLT